MQQNVACLGMTVQQNVNKGQIQDSPYDWHRTFGKGCGGGGGGISQKMHKIKKMLAPLVLSM